MEGYKDSYPLYPRDIDRAIEGVHERREAIGRQIAKLRTEYNYLFELEVDFGYEKARREYQSKTPE